MIKIRFIWILGALMIGCGNAQNIQQEIIGTWYLSSIYDGKKHIDYTLNKSNDTPFVIFNINLSLNGNAGCNNFFGSYKIRGNDELITSGAGMTRMLCPNEAMLTEDMLINIISDGISKVSISGSELILQKAQIKAIFHK